MSDRSERGAASFVVLAVIAVVITVGLAGMVTAGYLVAAHRAQAAADLAALGGAAEFARGGPACPRVRTVARDNGADLVTCDQVGDQLDFVITARVRVPVRLAVPAPFPRSVEAIAYAGAEST